MSIESKGVLLADSMGLGKSYQSMAVAVYLKINKGIKKCLIICPATTKHAVWEKEIQKHTNEDCIIVGGPKQKRMKQIEDYFMSPFILFLVVGFESFRADLKTYKKFGDPWNLIIIDESVRIKNPRSQITEAVKEFSPAYKIALSGWPLANRVEDIWSQVDWINPGCFGSYWSFEDTYMQTLKIPVDRYSKDKADPSKPQKYFKEIIGYKNLDKLKEKLAPLYIRRLKENVLDLPPKIYSDREVELVSEQKKAYKSMKEEMLLFVRTMKEQDVLVKAQSILIQMLRLSQITSGFITDVSMENPTWFENSAKLKIIQEIVEETIASGDKIVLWSRWVPMVKHLIKTYSVSPYNAVCISGFVKDQERKEAVYSFQNDPTCRVFVGQVQSGGMGIDLYAGNVQIFIDKAFLSPSTVLQAEDRQFRIGQTKTVVIINLFAKDTIDVYWEKLLKKKKKIANTIFDEKDMSAPPKTTKEDILELLQ